MQQRRSPGGPGSARGRQPSSGRQPFSGRQATGRQASGRQSPAKGAPRPARAEAGGRAPASPTAAPRRASSSSSGGTAKRTRAPQPRRFTGRATVLGVVMLVLLLAYSYPVRVYLAQEAEISALEDHQASQGDEIKRLVEESAKWNDDQYIMSQARSRLHMVLPGEKPLVVVDKSKATEPAGQPGGGARPHPRPWYGKLWSSVGAADKR